MAGWLEPVFALVRDQADAKAPGGVAVLTKLADVFLTQALRVALSEDAASITSSARPNRDPAVAHAIELIRLHPELP